ncbi:hypothetical protein C0J52_00393 [Blattella germanica]|nr:hypothetical protein C0J52_00393 [Blattella germanica]
MYWLHCVFTVKLTIELLEMAWRVWNNPKISNYINYVSKVKDIKFTFPEKYKGTILEKWAKYWKNVYIDYKEVAVEIAETSRERPIRTAFILTGLGFFGYCIRTNPDEKIFRDKLLLYMNELGTVGEIIRNPSAVQHLEFLERCYNHGVIRTLNLTVLSLVWLNDFDKASGLYPSQCDYLSPKYFTFHRRVVDIGFLGEWWLLNRFMKDYDINPSEFAHLDEVK